MNSNIIDNPKLNDNRNYNYSGYENSERDDYEYIVELVTTGTYILDLGCGNGSLIQKLIKEKNVTAKGIELSESGVNICKAKGLDVIQGRIDAKLPFSDNQFDFAICNVTIQMLMYPEILLQEMKRISRFQIVSFPNFAFYKNRIDLLINGRMPKPMLFGYKWYSTGHIHQISIKDFHELIHEIGELQVKKILCIKSKNIIKDFMCKSFPNLFMTTAIFLLSKKNV